MSSSNEIRKPKTHVFTYIKPQNLKTNPLNNPWGGDTMNASLPQPNCFEIYQHLQGNADFHFLREIWIQGIVSQGASWETFTDSASPQIPTELPRIRTCVFHFARVGAARWIFFFFFFFFFLVTMQQSDWNKTGQHRPKSRPITRSRTWGNVVWHPAESHTNHLSSFRSQFLVTRQHHCLVLPTRGRSCDCVGLCRRSRLVTFVQMKRQWNFTLVAVHELLQPIRSEQTVPSVKNKRASQLEFSEIKPI